MSGSQSFVHTKVLRVYVRFWKGVVIFRSVCAMTAVELMATIAPQTGVYLPPEHGLVHMSKKMYALCKLDVCLWMRDLFWSHWLSYNCIGCCTLLRNSVWKHVSIPVNTDEFLDAIVDLTHAVNICCLPDVFRSVITVGIALPLSNIPTWEYMYTYKKVSAQCIPYATLQGSLLFDH